jgi:hypothetical protein
MCVNAHLQVMGNADGDADQPTSLEDSLSVRARKRNKSKVGTTYAGLAASSLDNPDAAMKQQFLLEEASWGGVNICDNGKELKSNQASVLCANHVRTIKKLMVRQQIDAETEKPVNTYDEALSKDQIEQLKSACQKLTKCVLCVCDAIAVCVRCNSLTSVDGCCCPPQWICHSPNHPPHGF